MNPHSMTCVLLFLLLLIPGHLGASGIRGLWREIAPLPSARQEVAVTALGKDIYVIGGLIPGNATDSVSVLDAVAGSWTDAPDLPRILHHAAAAQTGGKIYSIGGYLGFTFSPGAQVYEFDPALQQWEETAPLPESRGALAAAVIDGKIYAVGGTGPTGDSGSLFRYDPATQMWETLAPMPTARDHHAAAAIGGRLYVVGGRRVGNLSALEIFDPATGQWETGPPLPTARSGIAAVAFGGLLWVFGGEIPGVFDEVEVFDPDRNRWSSFTPMALPRHGIGAAVYENRIVIPGGATAEGLGATALSDELVLLENVTVLAQFADSPEITSQLLASNFGEEAVELVAEARSDDGQPLPILANGVPAAEQTLTLQPGETRILSSPGVSSPPATGFVRIYSSAPVLAHVLFSSDSGFAGVLGQAPSPGFGVPVLRSVAGRLNSGVALANVNEEPCTVLLILLNLTGEEIARAEVVLSGFGHRAGFINELFPGSDLAEFQGSLTGTAECDIGAMAILLRRDQMATLPVQGF